LFCFVFVLLRVVRSFTTFQPHSLQPATHSPDSLLLASVLQCFTASSWKRRLASSGRCCSQEEKNLLARIEAKITLRTNMNFLFLSPLLSLASAGSDGLAITDPHVLPQLHLNATDLGVSGLSAGAFMSVQFHVS
jgi:hypothetical protein